MRVSDRNRTDRLVAKYSRNILIFRALAENIFDLLAKNSKLVNLVHSFKFRVKDPEHLRDKLYRKCHDALKANKPFEIAATNLYQKINDLIGIRLLHLHTSQTEYIDKALQECLANEDYGKREGPIAKTWDDESRAFFKSIGIKRETSKTQYTSVHYVYDVKNDLKATFEIQVRTLAEELWGEVDHKINYPHKHRSLGCREQIAVLARATSTCTRLVDSIFRTHTEFSTSLTIVNASAGGAQSSSAPRRVRRRRPGRSKRAGS